jgi:hypothetical protein
MSTAYLLTRFSVKAPGIRRQFRKFLRAAPPSWPALSWGAR